MLQSQTASASQLYTPHPSLLLKFPLHNTVQARQCYGFSVNKAGLPTCARISVTRPAEWSNTHTHTSSRCMASASSSSALFKTSGFLSYGVDGLMVCLMLVRAGTLAKRGTGWRAALYTYWVQHVREWVREEGGIPNVHTNTAALSKAATLILNDQKIYSSPVRLCTRIIAPHNLPD